MAPDENFDPLAPDVLADPPAAYKRLRETCPVAHGERWGGFWVLSRHDDIVQVTRDHRCYVNSVQNVVPKVTTTGKRPPLHFDPPEQTLWRKAMAGPFKPESLSQLEPRIRPIARRLLMPLVTAGEAEMFTGFNAAFPILVLCEFLNAPADETFEDIKAMSERFLVAFHSRDHAALEVESRKLYGVAAAILDARRKAPLDPDQDLASALLAMRIDGAQPSDEMLQGVIRQLLVAGHVAASMAIGSAMLHLARDRELQSRLRAQPALIAEAVDEFLRLYTPNQAFCRTPAHDVTLHDRHIAKDEPIVLLYPSANRDAAVFDDPDEFRFGRPIRHLAFGNGVHKCVGERVARLEIRVALEELLAATSDFSLTAAVSFARWPEYGPNKLPLSLVPR